MSYTIAAVVGFILAVILTGAIVGVAPSILRSIPLAIFIFFVCWGIMIYLCKIGIVLAIIIGIIALIVYIIKKRKPLNMDNDINSIINEDSEQNDAQTVEETSAQTEEKAKE